MPSALIQLPVPHPDPLHARTNVPLGPGYLAAYAATLGEPTVLAPRAVQDHGGDDAILHWLDSLRPSVLGFTTWLWNIERSLYIARAWKALHPDTVVVVGGAEIAEGRSATGADIEVAGEGEAAWARILRSRGTGLPPRLGPETATDLGRTADPYLAGILAPEPGDSVYLETVRGCTRRCEYCYYSGASASGGLRPFPRERIARVVELARDRGAADIYIMDPCFNAAPDHLEKLGLLAAANTGRIPLHTEIELESVTPRSADLYREAGFVSVEAGLQSTNREALRAVSRGFRRAEFLRGARLLADRGIRVRTGIIMGLPCETPSTFLETITFVRDAGLGDGAEVHPLAVLPGTGLRRRAAALGLDYMGRPPYWVLSNGRMGPTEMAGALREAQDLLDLDFFPPALAHFRDPAPGLTGYRDLRRAGAARILARELEDGAILLATSLTLRLAGPEPGDPEALARIGRALRRRSPHTMTQLVVECSRPPPWDPWEDVAAAFHEPDHYLDRVHYYHAEAQMRHSTRLIHLTADPATASLYYTPGAGERLCFDLHLRYTPALERNPEILDHQPPLVARDTARDLPPAVVSAYRGAENLIVREDAP